MVRFLRRWNEWFLLFAALAALYAFLDFPPPIGRSVRIEGLAHNVPSPNSRGSELVFWVRDLKLGTNRREQQYESIRDAIHEGAKVVATVWDSRFSDVYQIDDIVVDGVDVTPGDSRTVANWLFEVVYAGAAISCGWIFIICMKHPVPLWTRYKRAIGDRAR